MMFLIFFIITKFNVKLLLFEYIVGCLFLLYEVFPVKKKRVYSFYNSYVDKFCCKMEVLTFFMIYTN
jgi:hypothetical protein